MVGGNPQGDAYGFRHWNNPGAFAEYLSSGSLGRFEGFLACMWSAGTFEKSLKYLTRMKILILLTLFSLLYRWTRVHFHGGCRSQAPSHLHKERLQDRLLAFRSLFHHGRPVRWCCAPLRRPNAGRGHNLR